MKKYEVFQSPLAERKLLELLDYLESEWGYNSKTTFINKFKATIKSLEVVPFSFPLADVSRGIHKCVVTKQTSIYYRVLNEEIEIITLMDNRQDQKQLFEDLKWYFTHHRI